MIPLLSLIGELGTGFLKSRAKKQEQKAKIEDARVTSRLRRMEKGEDADNDLDQYFVRTHGFIQRLSFIIFLIPAIMAFTGHDEAVMKGFEALEKMPLWYQYTLGGMMIAIWGYRKSLSKVIQTKLNCFTRKHNGGGEKGCGK